MSPKLFKIYIQEISTKLFERVLRPIPERFHLLYEDDVVPLTLDSRTLQRLLDCLHEPAEEWELTLNGL